MKKMRIVLLSLFLTVAVGVGTAAAASVEVSVDRTPFVVSGASGPSALGTISIVESEGFVNALVDGDTFRVELPEGVIWHPSTAVEVYDFTAGSTTPITPLIVGETILNVTIAGADDAHRTAIYIKPQVTLNGFAGGDIHFAIDSFTSAVPEIKFDDKDFVGGKIPVQEVSITALDKTKVVEDTKAQAFGTIRIEEAYQGSIAANDELSFTLPAGVKFSRESGYLDFKVISGDAEFGVPYYHTDSVLRVPVKNASTIKTIVMVTFNKVDVGKDVLGDLTVLVSSKRANGEVVVATSERNLVKQPAGIFIIGERLYAANGTQAYMDVAPYIKDNRTYLPIRYVGYVLGIADKDITWDAEEGVVTLTKDKRTITLTIGELKLKVSDADDVMMDVAPEISENRTSLPIRWVVEAFGYTADWNPATLTVTIK